MASPGSLKGQRRGTCRHAMADFDLHEKCACCREKKVGDLCVKGHNCVICEGLSDSQCEILSTPSYKICKDNRTGTLVSPKDVTAISSVDLEEQASSHPTAHPPTQAPDPSTSSQPVSYVTSAQFEEMNDKWAEHFARFGDKSKETVVPDQLVPASNIPGPGDFMQEPMFRQFSSVSSSSTSQKLTSTGPSTGFSARSTKYCYCSFISSEHSAGLYCFC